MKVKTLENWMELTQTDKDIIQNLPQLRQAEIWCDLNQHITPDEFSHYDAEIKHQQTIKPKNWTKQNIVTYLMAEIADHVPHKELSRIWNRDRMTPEEFEDFYAGTYLGDLAARDRDRIRITRKLAEQYEVADLLDWTKDPDSIEQDIATLVEKTDA